MSTTWFSLSGPAGLPADIVQKVNREVVKTMGRPEIEQRMRQEGMVTQALSPAEFLQLIEAETVTVAAGDRAGGTDREVRGVCCCPCLRPMSLPGLSRQSRLGTHRRGGGGGGGGGGVRRTDQRGNAHLRRVSAVPLDGLRARTAVLPA